MHGRLLNIMAGRKEDSEGLVVECNASALKGHTSFSLTMQWPELLCWSHCAYREHRKRKVWIGLVNSIKTSLKDLRFWGCMAPCQQGFLGHQTKGPVEILFFFFASFLLRLVYESIKVYGVSRFFLSHIYFFSKILIRNKNHLLMGDCSEIWSSRKRRGMEIVFYSLSSCF